MKITRTVEENLIVVYTDENGVDHERDATPADLALAGYVPLAAFVGPLDLLSPPTLAGALEAIAALARSAEAATAEAWAARAYVESQIFDGSPLGAGNVREECLVAQAVAANVDIRVCEDDGGGFMVGVHESGCDEELARCVPAADVPATLARLLGEVSRG